MKTKRVVVGALTAAMLSLSVCSFAPVAAAGETVQISVGTATVKAGESFSLDVSLSGVPTTGIQGCEFALEYDSSLITIDSAKAGAIANTGADGADTSGADVFDFSTSTGTINLAWSTGLEDSKYWIKSDGVFCTVSGKALSSAKSGSTAEVKVVAVKHATNPGSSTINTEIKFGYSTDDGVVKYSTKTTNGSVKIGSNVVAGLKGDANCSDSVEVADAVMILQSIANPSKYALSDQGKANADVDGNGVDSEDALKIQKYCAGIISSL